MTLAQRRTNVLVYDHIAMSYGSGAKLLQTVARSLDPSRFRVTFLYGDRGDPQRANYFRGSEVELLPFEYQRRLDRAPFTIIGMRPHILDVIAERDIDCVMLFIWSNYQFPLTVIPASVPIIAISAFGQWTTNGNVVRTYCSGSMSLGRARLAGCRTAELFFNPIDPPPGIAAKPPVSRPIVFGRIGRPDDAIFDPISLRAFRRLEAEYGAAVRYDVVAPPPAMRAMVRDLGLRRVRLLDPIIDDDDLWRFYREIDVMAHARYDGETLGVAIGEAMLAGVPIVTHVSHYNNEHIRFLLEPSFARWAPPDDDGAYYEHLRWFVDHPEEIRPMGALAREKALSLFGAQHVMARVEADVVRAAGRATHRTLIGRARGIAVGRIVTTYQWSKFVVLSMAHRALGGPDAKRWAVLRAILRAFGLTERQRMVRSDPELSSMGPRSAGRDPA